MQGLFFGEMPSLLVGCNQHLPLFWCRSVTDLRPRKMDVEQCTLLCNLAEMVARGLELGSTFIQDTISNSSRTPAEQASQPLASTSGASVSAVA